MSDGQTSETRGDSLVGQVVDGRFEILRLLGAGAMGRIYLARQTSLDVLRALKVIDVAATADPSAEKRFRREALAMSRLQHAHIAQVIDYGALPRGGHFIAMEYIEGANLHETVANRGSLPLPDALTVLTQIAEAIAYAHNKGIVHRDLKPANILLRDEDVTQVKVIDFGLAKLAAEEAQEKLTGDQQILGTPIFMSPEQCMSEEVRAPADIYGLAGLAYYCLSGKPVFLEKTFTGIVMAQSYHEPLPISHRCPTLGIPPALDAVLLECLRKRPAERPAATEVMARLKEIAVGTETSPLERTAHQAVPAVPAVPPRVESSNILDSPEVLASAIWLDHPEEDGLSASGARSPRAEGLFNQLTAFLMEFAQELQHHLNLTGSVGYIANRIDSLQEASSGLEMDIALLESELADVAPDPAATGDIERQCAELRSQVTELRRSVNREYRNLYQYVISYRREVHDSSLQSYYVELETLVHSYLEEIQRLQRTDASTSR